MQSIGTDPREEMGRNREPWLAASLSWVLPGAGQLYSRLWTTGIALILLQVAISVVGVAMLIDSRVPLVALAAVFACDIALSVGAAIAAFRSVRRRNTTEFESTRTQAKDPWLAVFLSVFIPPPFRCRW